MALNILNSNHAQVNIEMATVLTVKLCHNPKKFRWTFEHVHVPWYDGQWVDLKLSKQLFVPSHSNMRTTKILFFFLLQRNGKKGRFEYNSLRTSYGPSVKLSPVGWRHYTLILNSSCISNQLTSLFNSLSNSSTRAWSITVTLIRLFCRRDQQSVLSSTICGLLRSDFQLYMNLGINDTIRKSRHLSMRATPSADFPFLGAQNGSYWIPQQQVVSSVNDHFWLFSGGIRLELTQRTFVGCVNPYMAGLLIIFHYITLLF